MSMHALSRDTEAFPHPCIYAQVEVPREPRDEDEDADGDNEDDAAFDGDEQTIELRFVPDESGAGALYGRHGGLAPSQRNRRLCDVPLIPSPADPACAGHSNTAVATLNPKLTDHVDARASHRS